MILPQLPARVDKRTNQINRFLGLNWTENYTAGEFRDTIGLSSDKYPCLSQRLGVTSTGLENVSSIYEWGDMLIYVSGTTLYIDGEAVTTVEAGTKQYAVINKSLIVMPDQLIVDLEDKSVKQMSDPVRITADSPIYIAADVNASNQITHNSIKTTYISGRGGLDPAGPFLGAYPEGTDITGLFGVFYGFDPDAVEACWHDGAWDWKRLDSLKKTFALANDPVALDAGEQIADYPCYFRGMVVLLSPDYKIVASREEPDTGSYNQLGQYWYASGNQSQGAPTYRDPKEAQYFTTINGVSMYTFADITSAVVATVGSSDILYYEGNANDPDWAYLKVTQNGTEHIGYVRRSAIHLRSRLRCYPNISAYESRPYQTAGIVPFADSFTHGGYKVKIEGTKYGLYDTEAVVVSATPNKLTFSDNTFNPHDVWAYRVTETNIQPGQYTIRANNQYYTFTTTERIVYGNLICIRPTQNDTVFIWDTSQKKTLAEYTAVKSSTGTWDYDTQSVDPINPDGTMVITKDIPDIDYICESNNRLWGVSNDTKTIYASSLGDPTDWWSTGLDDGAYQLAVASEGPFTGIIEYGGAVLAWKESSLTKILGSYPSQYYTAEYQYSGVQDGAYDSMRIINGVLYYKGTHGFYAYTASPTLISAKLGDPDLRAEHAGSDGKKYYCSASIGDQHMVLVYDIEKGLWLKESEIQVDGWAYTEGDKTLDYLSGGSVYRYDPASTERVEWKAEFCPFIEGTSSNSVWTVLMGKKGYTKLILFAEMEENSFLKAEVKEDNKPWREIGTKIATYPLMFRLPIRLGRCARVALRLSGRGRVMLRAINREYVAGSDK